MAIADVQEYAHLTQADIENLGAELDAIRRDIEESRGSDDARYIRNVIRFQRTLELSARAILFLGFLPPAWLLGVGLLGTAKIIENMEIGHNVMHGQWDWMNDPEIHSQSWEWDNAGTAKNWRHTHNYLHHKYTNVLGMDDDIGFGLLRVTRDQPWKPFYLGNPLYNLILQLLFQYGVAIQHLELGRVFAGRIRKGTPEYAQFERNRKDVMRKIGRLWLKDYLIWPALTGPLFLSTFTANLAANAIRNVWSNAVIFCGHFPDGAEKFTKADIESETQEEWYLRQMLGSANISGGRLMHFMTGNLSHQIEHHLFPDLPSNRYREIAERVRALAEKYDLPYTTGSLAVQYLKSWRTVCKLALPNTFLLRTSDAAPETNSERRFGGATTPTIDPATGRRHGLRSALAAGRRRLPFSRRRPQRVAA